MRVLEFHDKPGGTAQTDTVGALADLKRIDLAKLQCC